FGVDPGLPVQGLGERFALLLGESLLPELDLTVADAFGQRALALGVALYACNQRGAVVVDDLERPAEQGNEPVLRSGCRAEGLGKFTDELVGLLDRRPARRDLGGQAPHLGIVLPAGRVGHRAAP